MSHAAETNHVSQKAGCRKCKGMVGMGWPLSPDQLAGEGEDRVIDFLKQKKHPAKQPLVQSAITGTSSSNFYPVLFDETNGPRICSVALKMQGAAGPSGLDASCWKRMYTS